MTARDVNLRNETRAIVMRLPGLYYRPDTVPSVDMSGFWDVVAKDHFNNPQGVRKMAEEIVTENLALMIDLCLEIHRRNGRTPKGPAMRKMFGDAFPRLSHIFVSSLNSESMQIALMDLVTATCNARLLHREVVTDKGIYLVDSSLTAKVDELILLLRRKSNHPKVNTTETKTDGGDGAVKWGNTAKPKESSTQSADQPPDAAAATLEAGSPEDKIKDAIARAEHAEALVEEHIRENNRFKKEALDDNSALLRENKHLNTEYSKLSEQNEELKTKVEGWQTVVDAVMRQAARDPHLKAPTEGEVQRYVIYLVNDAGSVTNKLLTK
ncbi:hypothetical protein F4780DRAFT_795468 [Xylariomycetidae sp. FL0641]|nr:hypothetical protein F4780DRAFT_795468 [Xylariomycetidae sp. FL0641]